MAFLLLRSDRLPDRVGPDCLRRKLVTGHMFLDFEASSTRASSYPIEIGWCDEFGCGEGHLILPEAAWVDWSATAEGIHGISSELLGREGRPAAEVAQQAARALCRSDIMLLVSSEGHDGRWLRLLFNVADLPSPRVHSFLEAVLSIEPLRALLPLPGATDFEERRAYVRSLGWRLVSEAREAEGRRGVKTHRALLDAQAMCRVWRSVRAGAATLAGRGKGCC